MAVALAAAALAPIGVGSRVEAAPSDPAPRVTVPSRPAAPEGLDGAVQGIDAVDGAPDLVAAVADTNDLSLARATDLLADPTVWVRPDGHVFFADPVDHAHEAEAHGDAADHADADVSAIVPYATTFQLHSRPGSKRTIYLDFDGQLVSGTAWSSTPIDATAYDSDGAPGFSASELDEIQTIWQRTAEDFAAFDIDVTTEDPGTAAIRRDTAADDTYGTRVVITDLDASKVTQISASGVAFFDAFNAIGAQHDQLQPAWAFPGGLGYNAKWVGEVVSHEVGHNLGLSHDGGNGDGEYYQGHGVWAPIMGSSYTAPVTQWSKGEYTAPSNTEDDLTVMAGHGAVAIADDHTDATGTATTLTSRLPGRITASTDKDLFKYVAASSGSWTFRAEPTSTATNLDLKLTLLSAAGAQLATNDPAVVEDDFGGATGLDAAITFSVVAGTTYYLRVEPTSYLTPATGYSTYGTLGTYNISASNQATCASLDTNEPDSSYGTERVATSGQATSGRICRGDLDYAGLPVKAGQQIDLSLLFSHAAGNLDLALIDPTGAVVATSTSTDDDETISHTATKTGVYVAEIGGKTTDVATTYTFTMTAPLCPADDSFENNDTLGTAKTLAVGVDHQAVACVGDADFFTLPVALDTQYRLIVTSLSRYGSLVLDDYDASGAIIDTDGADFPDDELYVSGFATSRTSARFRIRTGSGRPNLYTVQVARAPDAPTGVTATPGFESATVSWTPPVQTGGEPVYEYSVEALVGTEVVGYASGPAPPLIVTGLQSGVAHTVRVTAANAVGQGPVSSAAPVTPNSTVTVPSAPYNLSAVSFSGTPYLTWTDPATNGGSALTGYVLTPFIGGVAQATRQLPAGSTFQTLTGLTPGVTYTFKLAAKNVIGTGPQSTMSGPLTIPASVPGAPTNVTATPQNGFAILSWTAPTNDGGAEILGYEMTVLQGGVEQFTIVAPDTGTIQSIGPLDNGTTYTFKVAAYNEAGVGAKSAASNAVTPSGANPPGAPTGVTASAGNAQATVSWTAPGSNGGSAITGYVVTPFIGASAQPARTFNTTATSQTITGLTNGTTYTFRVAAKNVVGTGTASSASAAVTPQAPPPSGARYVPITPCRVFDTRVTGAGGRLTGSRSIVVTGTTGFDAQGGKAGGCGIPAGTVAVEASITAVAPQAAGRLRVHPVGGTTPTFGFLEWVTGQSITNTGLVNLATSGSPQLVLANETGSTHIVVDVQGYFAPKATAPSTAAKYVAMTPCRIVDTRVAGGAFTDQQTRSYAVRGGGTTFAAQGGKSGGCAIPSGATAIEASVTAVGPTSAGYARAWPTGATPPTATFLNYELGRSLTNTGTFSLASSSNAKPLTLRSYGTKTQYVIDVQGYFLPQASAPSTAAVYVPLAGCDLVDTRSAGGSLGADVVRSYVIKGAGTAFADQGASGGGCAIPTTAVAVEVTLTARGPAGSSYARMWPAGGTAPTATFLNSQSGRDIANTGTVAIATTGSPQLTLRNYGTATHYTLSAQGYFLPQA